MASGFRSAHYSRQWYDARKQFNYTLTGVVKQKVGARLQNLLVDCCKQFQNNMIKSHQLETNNVTPIYTHNLMDSTCVAAYKSGRLITFFYPQQTATVPQKYKPAGRKRIWGVEEAQKMRRAGMGQFTKGFVITLFTAVPYADDVNEGSLPHLKTSTPGYFDRLSEIFKNFVEGILYHGLVAGYGVKPRK